MAERDHLKTAPGMLAWVEWPLPERAYFWGRLEHSTVLHRGDELALHFDPEGRLRRAFIAGVSYLRGLDGRVLRRALRPWHAGDGPTTRRPLDSAALHGLSRDAIDSALRALEKGPVVGPPGRAAPESPAMEALSRALSWSPAHLAEEARRFAAIYAPIGILPPDAYRALVLQATVGCRYNRCAFCSLYRSSSYRRRSVPEFREHVRQVKELFGEALEGKRGVFLGDANALALPADDLEAMLETVAAEVPSRVRVGGGPASGVSLFSDAFDSSFPSLPELRRLASGGLARVHLGIESGDGEVLRRLRKPARREGIRERVERIKGAGLSLSAIVLAGAGGRSRGREHVRSTVELLGSLPLDRRDLVYVSPLRPTPGEGWPGEDLTAEAIAREEAELRSELRALGLRVSRYHLERFIYC